MTTEYVRTIDQCDFTMNVVESLPVRTATDSLAVKTEIATEVVRAIPIRVDVFTQPETIYVAS